MGTGSLACSCLFANCSTLQIFLLVSQVKTDFNMSGAHSGVAIREEVLEAFQELKIGHKHRFVLFKMTDNMGEVVVDAQGGAGDSWDQFVSSLPQDDCRYAIYDSSTTKAKDNETRFSWL